MKTKLSLLLLAFCFYPFISFAQNETLSTTKSLYPEDRRWLLNMASGTSFDLSGSSSNPYADLLGSRQKVAFMHKFRLTHLFSKKVGWYADVQFDFYRDRRSGYLDDFDYDDPFIGLFLSIGEGLGEAFRAIHPSAGAGLMYRIEYGRWKIHPELGVGYGVHLSGRNKSKTSTDRDGIEYSATYRQQGHSLYMNAGVSANYFISRRCFFVFNAGFRQPLQKSHAELTTFTDGIEVEKRYYETSRIGRTLNLSLGFGFTVGRHR